MRRELVELRPEADESNLEPPSESDSRAAKLQARLSYRGTLDAWRRRLGNVQRRYDYAVRLLRLRTRTSAGLALLNLEAVPDELNPPARILADGGEDTLSAANDLMRWESSESYSLFKLTWQERLDRADLGIIDKRVADLRDAVERLREDLHRRIGATRSRLALVNRFKLRCEWHDRERMLAVADDDRLPGGPEAASAYCRILAKAHERLSWGTTTEQS